MKLMGSCWRFKGLRKKKKLAIPIASYETDRELLDIQRFGEEQVWELHNASA
jgi:hypothetical protein